MSDHPTGSHIDNAVLRLLIQDAVKHEFDAQIAPLRTQMQIYDGTIKQFNRDLGGMQHKQDDLEDLVRGNLSTGSVGLAKQVEALQAGIDLIKQWMQDADDQRRQTRALIKAVSAVLAIVVPVLTTLVSALIQHWLHW